MVSRTTVVFLALVLGAGCVDRLPTQGLRCPCGPGWTCDRSHGEPGICREDLPDAHVADRGTVPEVAVPDSAPGSCKWRQLQRVTNLHVQGVWGTSPTNMFFVGFNGVAIKYDGKIWHTATVGDGQDWLFSVWGTSATNIYAVGCRTGDCLTNGVAAAFRYNGSGWDNKSWTRITCPKDVEYFGSLWGASATSIYIAAGYGKIYHFDGTSAFKQLTSGSWALWDIWGSGPADIHVCGNEGTLHNYDGKTWSSPTSGTRAHLEGIWGSSYSDVWAVGGPEYLKGPGTILHYNGSAWSTRVPNTKHHFTDIWGSSTSNIWAVGHSGFIMHYDGKKWSEVQSPTTYDLASIHGTSSTDVWAVGAAGTILRYSCSGGSR